MKNLLLFSTTLFLLSGACRQQAPSDMEALLAHFKALPLTDTLHVEITQDETVTASADTIPNALFFSLLPPALLEDISHIADSAEAVILPRQHFPLDKNHEAYWVEIHQFWFKNHSLLVYHTSKKAFTSRTTLAEWYGGDGGQILTGSWLFDYDGDKKKDIIRREIQHSLVNAGEEIEEHTEEAATLLLWKKGDFAETPIRDTAAFIRQYPIASPWK